MFYKLNAINPCTFIPKTNSKQFTFGNLDIFPNVRTEIGRSKLNCHIRLTYHIAIINDQETTLVEFCSSFLSMHPLLSECFIFDMLTLLKRPLIIVTEEDYNV